MKNKILVIFFLALICSIFIYKTTLNNKTNILILGDKYFLNSNFKTYDAFLKDKYYNVNSLFAEENETYDKIINKIKTNYSMKIKNKREYLNQKIASSTHIILSSNNKQNDEKCKNNRVSNYYLKKTNEDIANLVKLIEKISTAKIIIIDNSCSNSNLNYNHVKLKNITNSKYNNLTLKDNYMIYKKILEKIEEKS